MARIVTAESRHRSVTELSDDDRLAQVRHVSLPGVLHGRIVAHGRRKLAGHYLAGEHQEQKAFGLLGACVEGTLATVAEVVPLARNHRHLASVASEFDAIVGRFAVPSETPLSQRGWMADPVEVLEADRRFAERGCLLLGAYHMHRVAWEGDPLRDRCTALDEHLASGSGLWSVVLSMVDPAHPRLRAFFEGSNEREARVILDH